MQRVPKELESSDLHSSFRSWEGAEALILTLLQSTDPSRLVKGGALTDGFPRLGILAVSIWK